MGVITDSRAAVRLRELRYVWGWRARYWWMDTEAGERARLTAFCLAVLVVVMQLIRMAVVAVLPEARTPGEPAEAVYWWVVQLIILVVAAAVAYAMRPKVEPPKAQEHESPTVKDGTAVRDCGGTVWIDHDDNFLLAWKIVGRDAIRTKAGKK